MDKDQAESNNTDNEKSKVEVKENDTPSKDVEESTNTENTPKEGDNQETSENPIVEISIKYEIHDYPDDFYREYGFQHSCENKTLENLLIEYNQWFEKHLELLKKQHDFNQADVQKRLEDSLSKITEVKKLKSDYAQQIVEYQSQVTPLEDKINKTRQELYQILKNYNGDKKELLKKLESELRKEIRDEIESISDHSVGLSTKYKDSNKAHLERRKEVRDKIFKGFNKDLTNFENQLAEVQARIKAFNSSFVNPSANRILWLICLGATGICGYFFSIFAELKGLDNTDQSDFAVELLFSFGINLFNKENGIWLNLLYLLIIFGVMCILVGLFFLLLHFVDRRVIFPPNFNENEPGEEQGEWSKTTRKGLFHSYISLLPIAVVILLVSLFSMLFSAYSGFDADKINDLTLSIGAQIIGSSLALLFGGLVYIYISFALESRVAAKEPLGWKDYKELKIAAVLLGISLLALPAMLLIPDKHFLSIFSLTMFVVSLLASSMTISHALKFTSLLQVKGRLEYSIAIIRHNLYHHEPMAEEEDILMNKNLLLRLGRLNSQFLTTVEESFQDKARYIYQDRSPTSKRKGVRLLIFNVKTRTKRFLQPISQFFRPSISKRKSNENNDNQDISTPYTAHEWEDHNEVSRDLLSDQYQMVKDKIQQIQTALTELNDLRKKIDDAKHDRSEYQVELNTRLETALEEKAKLESTLVNNNEAYNTEVKITKGRFQKINLLLRQGYETGLWYLKNKDKLLCKY